MPALGSLWYTLGIDSKQIDADLKSVEAKLKNLGVTVDVSKVRQTIEASVGATPFNATVNFGNARASLDAIFANKKYDVHVEAIASKLHESIKNALANFSTGANILPKKKELRKAVNDALLSAGFEINIGKVKGLNATINNALGSAHTLNVSVDPKKLASAIDKAVGAYKGGKQVSVEVKDKILKDSITAALKTEKFPIRVIVDKAEAQDAVRQALQAAGLQSSTGFTASDKRAWDAQSRRMEAEARAAAASALAQRRLAGARTQATNAADKHATATVSLNSALKGNITLAKELGGAIGAAYSVVALKNFMTKVVEIGGELEKQKLAMRAILGDEGMANTISSQINTLAVKSPFGIMELNQYAKQLTAFQIPYNELYDTMKRMADVSAAVGVDMGRIILAYGQVRAAKFLKGTELRQFTEANIPLIDMLAERFTKLKGEIVSAGDIMDMISNKEVSFEDVKAVLWELTGEGGLFYNMQEVLSESVSAKWKNLADALDLMFADIANSTSGPLKGLAELLTALTSKWDTIATAVASAVIVFGVAKVSTAAWNSALSKTTLSEIAQAKATKKLEAANLQVASTYRTLTAAEQGLIRTKGKLTAAQYVQLANAGKLTKEEALRLIALKRLDANSIGHIRTVLNISKQEVAAAQATKAWRVRLEQLKVSIKGFGSSIAAFFLNPVTLAMMAIGSLAALWQRHSAAMSAAKEVGDDLFTKASEGANNLKKTLDTLKPAEGLSDIDLTQGIEKMEQAIKDYSPTPINDMNEALTTQDGRLLTLAERYEALRKKVGELKEAFDGIQFNKVNKAVENALADTKEGWFFDGLEKNLKDYENAKSILDKHIRDYSVEHKEDLHNIVESASEQSEAYRNAIRGMSTDAQKFYELIFNGGRYGRDLDINLQSKIIDATEGGFWQNAGEGITNFDLRGTGQRANAAYNTLMADAEKFKERFNAALSEIGIDPKSVSPEQLSIALNSMLDKFEVGEDTKMILAKKLEELYNITLIDDKVSPIFTEKFREIANASSNKAVQEAMIVWQTQGWNKLSQTQKDLLESLFEQAKTQSKGSVEAIVGDMNTYLASHPGQWNVVINMVTSQMQKEMPDWTRNAISSRGGEFKGSKAAFGYLKTWGENGSQYGARNAAQQALQDAENELKSYVTEADKLTPAYKKALQKKEDIQEAINYLGWGDIQVKDQKSNKHSKGSQKDPLAESLKQRFKDIKDAWSEFQKWSKTEGREAAATRIGESGLFSTLSADKIPQTVEQYRALVAELENELRKAGVKGTARESLLNDLLKQLLDIDKTVADEQLKLALDKVSKEAERQLANWNLFDKIRKATGNQDLAMSVAFGMNADATTDYPTLVKKQFAEVANQFDNMKGLTYDMIPDASYLTDAPDEVKKAWEDTTKKLQQYAREQKDAIADILSEYQSLQDKLTKIDADRDRKIETVNKSDMSAPEKAEYIQRINVEADYQKFTQSADYLKFFSGIYSLTMQQAQEIGDKIRLNLDQRLQAEAISAEDYYKEIERINQQLTKLRNVKSDALTFLTGGVKGLQQKKLDTADSNVLAQMTKVQEAQEALEKAKATGDLKQIAAAELTLKLANTELDTRLKIRDAIVKDMESWQRVVDVVNVVNNIAGGMSDAFNTLRDMADSFGFDTESNAWETAAAVMDTLTTVTSGVSKVVQSAMNGDIGGVISGTFDTLLTPFTIWNKLHDKKLQKDIELSKRRFNQYDRLVTAIERKLNDHLGGYVDFDPMPGTDYGKDGAFGYERDMKKAQLEELKRQQADMEAMKGKDPEAIEDIKAQISELTDEIANLEIEAANALYGIDIKGYAETIGDALWDAFMKGEDAAEAFDKAVADIMSNVVKNILKVNILERAFQRTKDWLASEDGPMNDGILTTEEARELWQRLMTDGKKGMENWNAAMDAMPEDMKQFLQDNYDTSKRGLSAGIQSLTEDTADLLASYLNAIRADVAMQTGTYWTRLLDDSLPQMNIIAQSQLDTQRQIAENTLRNAVAAETIVQYSKSIDDRLRRAQADKSTGFWMR